MRQIDSKSSDIIFEMSGSMDRQPFFDGQTVIGKTEDSGASDYSSDRNDSDDRSARNDRNDSNDSLAHELLWNDPIESMKEWEKNNELDKSLKKKRTEFVANKARKTGYYFTALAA